MENKSPNRLAQSASPYLIQHAHNPVDWFFWGEEAFAKARSENRPIFLSIGYAACHWCHVMERESFENPVVAAFLNENFVSIKVDREERPDVDEVYMTAVQMMTGSGGWPLSVFLDNDLKPFYGGTYFPPEDRYGRPGFLRLLQMIKSVWTEHPDDVAKSAGDLTDALLRNSQFSPNTTDAMGDFGDIDRAARLVTAAFDPFRGGFGEAPKFPPTGQIDLLLRVWKRTGNSEYLEMVERTLQRMTAGGIFDQLGGGFARYSTDADWLVPHFEKMLYDNALLAVSLIDCGLATHKPEYIETAQRTLDWMLADMRDEGGGFHSSLDADSEGVEGKFYVWTPGEINSALGNEDGALFCEIYDISEKGNFEHGLSILHLAQPLKEASLRYKIEGEELARRLAGMREKLLVTRRKRIPPAKDDKVLTDWNSLAIVALARGYRATGEERYLKAAQEAADFIFNSMWIDGKLMHSWRREQYGTAAMLDDFAYYLAALTELYMADFDPRHLVEAERVADSLIEGFFDKDRGGFYLTPAGRKDLIVRTKIGHDGAMPSGNAIAALALYRLAQLLDREDLQTVSRKTVHAFLDRMKNNPTAHLRLFGVAGAFLSPSIQIAIIGDKSEVMVQNLLYILNGDYYPDAVVACPSTGTPEIALLKNRTKIDGKPAAYVCRDSVCAASVTDAEALRKLVRKS